ncbi:cyclin-domain-containing protein [Spinellus fusiger]|nr:cyclin-domain-containing protein [Spinellus fusiger]
MAVIVHGTDDSVNSMIPSLADFAASMVYLMWHARQPKSSGQRSAASANPTFKRFVLQVLTATRLTESVVYLAMKFIAILLHSNPTIQGDEGSEYRLLIVALMLSNKFLDDITFTNKTWAEVSGMKLQDLNVMEAEFLYALDYNLFVRDTEYSQWKIILDQCRERARMTCFDSYAQREEFIRVTLMSLGLTEDACKQEERFLYEQEIYQREQQQQREKEQERVAWESTIASAHRHLRHAQLNYDLRTQKYSNSSEPKTASYFSSCLFPPLPPMNGSHNSHGRLLPKMHHHPQQQQQHYSPLPRGGGYFGRCHEFNAVMQDHRFYSQPFSAAWDPFGMTYPDQDPSFFSSHPLAQPVQPRNVNTSLSWRNYP